jgi:hypothetical protein
MIAAFTVAALVTLFAYGMLPPSALTIVPLFRGVYPGIIAFLFISVSMIGVALAQVAAYMNRRQK